LEIGADTPEEIAVSIVAQLIQSRRGRKDRRRLSNYERIAAAAHVTTASGHAVGAKPLHPQFELSC
jgi:xanthine/CO dehydrogenase XdhC/CoxF family maturation factor